ncbi:MAG: NucA/NucB deoxyribonuclease domain-containing protein, partial [Thiomicrorhabdus sp.]|nr:NucA/NucB deoxyribonuclease domain-containing protein [Thiomicrorhabdus sp.]
EEEIYVHAEKDYRRLIKNNEIVKIEGELKVNVIQASEKKAKSIQITANDFIEFNLGANQIKMTPTQITVAGTKITIKGQGMTTIQGGMVKINAGGGGASQAKTNLDNMAVEPKAGEFGGFGKNVTEEISFTEKTKAAGAGVVDFLVGDLVDGASNAIDELKDGDIAGAVTEIAIGVAMTTPAGKVFKIADKGIEAVLGKGKTDNNKANGGIIKEGSNPVFEISKTKYPNHAKVIENAEKKGLPIKNLERGSGTKAAQRNRRRAQAEMRKKNGPPPKGYDYDEFPYASSNQGGKGAHVEPVKSTENQAAGRDLGNFYRENGIKEGDKYDVKITD